MTLQRRGQLRAMRPAIVALMTSRLVCTPTVMAIEAWLFGSVTGKLPPTILLLAKLAGMGSMDRPQLTREHFDAVLFDLDGVLTATAKLHAAAWKRMFDHFLQRWAATRGETFIPFDVADDYLRNVDGKPRFDGVRSFLASRGISLPPGTPDDPATAETVYGLGNWKNEIVNEIMDSEKVEAYPGSIRAVELLRERGFRTAVVSSSENCAAVLRSAGIAALFDARIDAHTATDLGLRGKPEPDMFLIAAQRLGADPARSIVVEDAIAGVQAGKKGGFGLVIGIARAGNADALREQGADIVVGDLEELLPAQS